MDSNGGGGRPPKRIVTGDRAGGIYFWESKAAAEACYTRDWTAMVTEKYGAPPDIFFAEVPVSVDNLAKVIEPA